MIFVWPAAESQINSLGKNNIIAHPHADFDGGGGGVDDNDEIMRCLQIHSMSTFAQQI